MWTISLGALVLPSAVGAQEGGAAAEAGEPAPSDDIEEFVVFGVKAVELGTEQTVSTTVFDAEALEAFGVQDIGDLAAMTPNLEIRTVSASTPTFFIRGVGLNDFASNATGAVAIYQDGVPIASPALQLGQIFDVAGAEVFRGPQTTGNQRNASAGLIAVSSALPTGTVESRLRVDYGNYDFVDSEGALALPLGFDDSLSTRLAFRFTRRDPWIENRCAGLPAPTQGACGSSRTSPYQVPAGLPDEVDDQKRWAARGLLRFEPPGTESDWLLNFHGSVIDQNSALGQPIGTLFPNADTNSGYIDPAIARIFEANEQLFRDAGLSGLNARRAAYLPTLEAVTDDIGRADPEEGAYDLVGQERLHSYGGSLRGELQLGEIEIQTITGGESYDRERLTDFDFSPDTVLETDSSDDAWQITQSLDLRSQLEQLPLRWNLGGYFLTENLDSDTNFLFNFARAAATFGREIDQIYSQDNYSFATYANLQWDLGEYFTLDAGARYNYDYKQIDLSVFRLFQGERIVDSLPAASSTTWTAPTYSVALTYRPTGGLSLYAKYSRGWKPGVFNAAVFFNAETGENTFAPEIKEADPEKIDAFEIGLDGRWFDGALEGRAALFYYKYHDYQVFILRNIFGGPPQFQIINANDAQIYGAELDLFAQPLLGRVPHALDQLLLEARFSWLESQFLDFTDTETIRFGGGNVTSLRFIDYSGNQLPNAPRFKVSGSIRWSFELGDLGRFGTLTPRYDLTYTSDVYFDPSEGVGLPPFEGQPGPQLPEYAIAQKDYLLHDVRLSWLLPGGIVEVAGWVRNLTDERYKTYAAHATGAQTLLNWIGDPRTYGGSVSFRW